MKKFIVGFLTVFMLLLGMPAANAGNGHRVCHNGEGYMAGMWFEVWETDGSIYEVWGGDCTPYQPGIRAMRAPEAWSIYYRNVGDSTIRRCINTHRITGWCPVGSNVNVLSVKPN